MNEEIDLPYIFKKSFRISNAGGYTGGEFLRYRFGVLLLCFGSVFPFTVFFLHRFHHPS